MNDMDKTKEQLIEELNSLRSRVSELESIARAGGDRGFEDIASQVGAQEILDALPFYVLIVDSAHNIIMANKAVKQLLGVNSHDIIGGFCPTIIHGSSGLYPHCPLEEAVRENRVTEREYLDPIQNNWMSYAIYPIQHKVNGRNVYFHMVYDISARKFAEENLKHSIDRLERVTDAIVQVAINTVEKRDPYICGHQQRVSRLACDIAREMGISEENIEGIHVAALLHDIGKIGIPVEILSKPGKLSRNEFNIVKEHAQIGYEIFNGIELSWPIARIIQQHHERLDGSGYPQGLQDKEILLEAKLIGVADVVEAMCSHRPYRPGLTLKEALEEITKNRGILYDAGVVDACLKLFNRKDYTY